MKIICWWSGGITSAVACKIAIDLYGVENCRGIMIDTHNEDEDTYRFKSDCEKWYGLEIECISKIGAEYISIEDVWRKYNSLNVANGAICSSELKRDLRKKWEKENDYSHQVFGFDSSEIKRALSMKINYPKSKPIFPLLMMGHSKKDCIEIVEEAGIEPPRAYQWGFHNNNCLQTGCVQGGIGYWQKMKKVFPGKFEAMASMEHELTEVRGEPVTMLKDQSKQAIDSGNTRVFLKPHPEYPDVKDISMMKGQPVKPLMEWNGFCGINDLMPKAYTETAGEINFQAEPKQLSFFKS